MVKKLKVTPRKIVTAIKKNETNKKDLYKLHKKAIKTNSIKHAGNDSRRIHKFETRLASIKKKQNKKSKERLIIKLLKKGFFKEEFEIAKKELTKKQINKIEKERSKNEIEPLGCF